MHHYGMKRLNFTLDDDAVSLLESLAERYYQGNKSQTVRAALESLASPAGRRVAFTHHGTWPEAPRTALAILGLPDGPSDAEVQSILNERLAGSAAFTQ